MPSAQVISAALRVRVLLQPENTMMTPRVIPKLMSANTRGPKPGLRSHWWTETHTSNAAATPAVIAPMRSRRIMFPPANDRPITPMRIVLTMMNACENWAPSRSQSLKLIPPQALRMTATQNTGSEKKRKVVKVVR